MIGDCNPIDGYLKGGYVVISKNTWNKFGPMNFIDEIRCFSWLPNKTIRMMLQRFPLTLYKMSIIFTHKILSASVWTGKRSPRWLYPLNWTVWCKVGAMIRRTTTMSILASCVHLHCRMIFIYRKLMVISWKRANIGLAFLDT